MKSGNLIRVSKSRPCDHCGHHDWCFYGGDAFDLCMRTASDRPKTLADGSVGWLHRVGDAPAPRPVREEKPAPILNVSELLHSWRRGRSGDRLDELSVDLGVTTWSLEALGCVHAPYCQTWGFPMRSGDNSYTGIRLRNINGDKWAEKGSHQGLFLPQVEPQTTVLITEGPTDTAAALSIGYFAIGKPNCCGGIPHLQEAVKRLKIRRAVIVSDLDDPGLRGAQTLAMHLPIPTAILLCPAKDMRQAVKNGMDKEMCDAAIRQLVWRQP